MLNVTWVQVWELEHTLRTVASVEPDVLRICICCWSNWIVSLVCGLYQKVRVGLPAGTVMVCVSVLLPFPLTRFVLPTWAENEPEWTGDVTIRGRKAPLVVQPLKLPVSKP